MAPVDTGEEVGPEGQRHRREGPDRRGKRAEGAPEGRSDEHEEGQRVERLGDQDGGGARAGAPFPQDEDDGREIEELGRAQLGESCRGHRLERAS
jgi:hypothetical protein